MITQNYHVWNRQISDVVPSTTAPWNGLLSTSVTDYTGTAITNFSKGWTLACTQFFKKAYPLMNISDEWIFNDYIYSEALMIGTGTTQPTASDYTLAAIVTSNLTNVSTAVTKNYISASNKSSYVITRTWTYTGEENITITEAGVYHLCAYDDGSVHRQPFLVARELFSTPLVVSPSETFTVTMTLEF